MRQSLAGGYGDRMDTDEQNTRAARGFEVLNQATDGGAQEIIDSIADVAPELARWFVEFGYGDVFSRPGLAPAQRELIIVGVLTALGGCEPQLAGHIRGALNLGVAPGVIVETIMQVVPYAGFPRALNGIAVAREVFTDKGLSPDAGADSPNP